MLKFELIAPAFNEAENIAFFIQRTAQAAEKNAFSPTDFQLVIVNNGSTDNTREVLSKLKKTRWGDWFRELSLSQNIGYGDGIWKGLTTTKAPIIGWTHADHQCDPSDAFRAYEQVTQSNGKTLVKGHRQGRSGKEKFVTHVFEGLANGILGLQITEINAQPKVFPRGLLEKLPSPPTDIAFDLYVLYRATKNGYAIQAIPVQAKPRLHGASKWATHFFRRYHTILKMVQYILRLRFT